MTEPRGVPNGPAKVPLKISVLVSCHNYRDYVVEAIESALAQTLPPFEVIVVDDGSTDGSGELLEQRYGRHPVVRVIRTPNHGQLATFVTGLRASSGDIVAFLDADDRQRAGYLERVAAVFAQRSTVGLVFCNMQQFGGATEPWIPDLHDEDLGTAAIRTWALQWYYGVPTSGITMRRRLGEQVLADLPETFYPEWRSRADDFLVFGAALLGAHRFYVGEPLVDYRLHGRNNWAGRPLGHVDMAQHCYRMLRLVAWYGNRAGLDQRALRWAVLEFNTKPRPRRGDFLTYFGLQLRAPLLLHLKLRALYKMSVTYALSAWKPRGSRT